MTRKYSKKRKKQQPTENQKNTKNEIYAQWAAGFYI